MRLLITSAGYNHSYMRVCAKAHQKKVIVPPQKVPFVIVSFSSNKTAQSTASEKSISGALFPVEIPPLLLMPNVKTAPAFVTCGFKRHIKQEKITRINIELLDVLA